MTTDIDRMIEEALQGEEQALFRETAREPGFFAQAFGLLGGPNGWVNVVMIVVQAETALSALHWGLPAAVLVLAALIVKLGMMPELQANRLMRELKRQQLQAALGRNS